MIKRWWEKGGLYVEGMRTAAREEERTAKEDKTYGTETKTD